MFESMAEMLETRHRPCRLRFGRGVLRMATLSAAAAAAAEAEGAFADSGADQPSPAGRARTSARRRRLRTEYLLFVAFAAPNFLFVFVFAYWPVIYNGYLSLTDWNMLAPVKNLVGLANYRDLFTDVDFLATLRQTAVFVVGVVAGSMVLGLATALLLNQRLAGRRFVRTMVFAPHVLSGAAVGTLWLFIFDPNYGLIRPLLAPLALTSPAWMTSSRWALPGLIIVYLWKNTGFVAIVYLAGMQDLPRDLYESAALDGADAWRLFRRITLPLLSPVTFFLLLTTIISTFQAFDVIAAMTGGGPGTSTTTLSWFIYERAFVATDAGHAAAAAMIMFLLLLAMTALQARFLERRVHYR
jgi:sn-glycerol 3-phosphate transport system permease protein